MPMAVTRLQSWTFYYIGSTEGHEYPDHQVGDEVNPRPFSGAINGQMANSFDPDTTRITFRNVSRYLKQGLKFLGIRGYV